jgi:hypothetical protein
MPQRGNSVPHEIEKSFLVLFFKKEQLPFFRHVPNTRLGVAAAQRPFLSS